MLAECMNARHSNAATVMMHQAVHQPLAGHDNVQHAGQHNKKLRRAASLGLDIVMAHAPCPSELGANSSSLRPSVCERHLHEQGTLGKP